MDGREAKIMWCGGLHEKVTEELLHELFVQVKHDIILMGTLALVCFCDNVRFLK